MSNYCNSCGQGGHNHHHHITHSHGHCHGAVVQSVGQVQGFVAMPMAQQGIPGDPQFLPAFTEQVFLPVHQEAGCHDHAPGCDGHDHMHVIEDHHHHTHVHHRHHDHVHHHGPTHTCGTRRHHFAHDCGGHQCHRQDCRSCRSRLADRRGY